jgi:hypothetical protein
VAETFITADSKKIHYWDRTIGANTVLDEFTLPGEYPLASYSVTAGGISIATIDSHIMQLMAGSSLNVRIRRIRFEQSDSATTAAQGTFAIYRLTTAGTGGNSQTPAKHDTADAASGATAMTLPTAKGTESTLLQQVAMVYRQVVSATQSQVDDAWEWFQMPNSKPLIIPAGTANGIAVKTTTAHASTDVNVIIEFVETSF